MILSPIPPPASLVWLTCTLKLLLQGQISSGKNGILEYPHFSFTSACRTGTFQQLPHALLNVHPITLPNPPSLIEHIRIGLGSLPFTLKTGQHQKKTSAQPCLAGDQLIDNLLQIHKGGSLCHFEGTLPSTNDMVIKAHVQRGVPYHSYRKQFPWKSQEKQKETTM